MFAIFDKERVDLILLDLNLPDEDGFTLAKRVRGRSDVPIIVLTARKEQTDRIKALEIGVNDYMVKPYDPKELALRARNMLGCPGSRGNAAGNEVITFYGHELDMSGRVMTTKDGTKVDLTPSEFNILAALVKSSNRALSRDYLLNVISHDNGDTPTDRTIDVNISRLRKKIEADPKNPRIIITIAGYGYKFAADKD